MTNKADEKIKQALEILELLELPRAQRNERSALTLLALLNLAPGQKWAAAQARMIGITPVMTFAHDQYGKRYAPNTRETFRRQTMHQFVEAGLALYNPDKPDRPVNSPKAVYQIEPNALALLRQYDTPEWKVSLKAYLKIRQTLASKYARERNMKLIPVMFNGGYKVRLSPGGHSQLIMAIVKEFAPRFTPDAQVIYVGDTGNKWGYFDKITLKTLGVEVDGHGKMPDVVLYYKKKGWLILVEAVTSHGPVNAKRHNELAKLFSTAKPGLVYVTAFPDRGTMARYLTEIGWETEVWVAEAPTHMIHFNGDRFLGPHE
ncbi:MAG: BsuBI/PstI family type II restriction endonuclease [Pseudomonadota bacterium]